ncbi:hypothetical protein V1478_018671 [Vespula squamosa]|uniref:Secreted protein n=1 Tax=Vespula squamosa TaxID=30214 RepID=A0ABD1ZVW7_VESSQ
MFDIAWARCFQRKRPRGGIPALTHRSRCLSRQLFINFSIIDVHSRFLSFFVLLLSSLRSASAAAAAAAAATATAIVATSRTASSSGKSLLKSNIPVVSTLFYKSKMILPIGWTVRANR